METGVAFLGAYEEEAFDQHNHLQGQAPFDGGLGDSVSFGRFAVDSNSWVKRSSFNHNQYLEELGSCSTPGSVRQKKAYFEAYYKAIAKQKALENALAEGNIEENMVENVVNGTDHSKGKQEDAITVESDAGMASVYAGMTDDARAWEQHPSVASSGEEETERVFIPEGAQVLNAEPQETNTEDVEGDKDLFFEYTEGLNSGSSQDSLHELYVELAEAEEFLPAPTTEKLEDELLQDADEFGQKSIQKLQAEREELVIQSESATQEVLLGEKELLPASDNIAAEDNADDRQDAEMVDKFETNGSPGQETYHTSNVQKCFTHSADGYDDVNTSKVSKVSTEKSLHVAAQGRAVKVTASASNTLSKLNKGSAPKRQGLKGATEMKSHPRLMNTGNSHTNVTVPQPFALATNKRAAVTGILPEQDGTRSSGKPACNGSLVHSLPLKKTQALVKTEKKSSRCRSSMEESRKQQEKLKHGTIVPNALKHHDMEPNQMAQPVRTGSSGKSRPSPAKSHTNTFSFKSDERAEKRREFNFKVEAKLSAMEAEKNQAEVKTQEEEEEEIKQLRRNLNFKATPMPNFYQESVQPKTETKRAGIPTTRAKSPKLGRKNTASMDNRENNSPHLSSSACSKQVRRNHCTPDKKQASGDPQLSRNSSALPKKPSTKSCKTVLPCESSRTESFRARQSEKIPGVENFSRTGSNPVRDPDISVEAANTLNLLHESCPPEAGSGSTTASESAATATMLVHDRQQIRNSAVDNKSNSNQSSNVMTSSVEDTVTATIPSKRGGNPVVVTTHSSEAAATAAAKERRKKDSHFQNGAQGEKMRGEKAPKRDHVRSGVAPATSSNSVQKNHLSKQSIKHREDLVGAITTNDDVSVAS